MLIPQPMLSIPSSFFSCNLCLNLCPFFPNPQHLSSRSHLANCSETYCWIFYWNKNLLLASPLSFCSICLLPFSDKLTEMDSPYFLPAFHYLSLTSKSAAACPVPALLLKSAHIKVKTIRHLVFFLLLWAIYNIWYLCLFVFFWPTPSKQYMLAETLYYLFFILFL